jgi:hypothetical protein
VHNFEIVVWLSTSNDSLYGWELTTFFLHLPFPRLSPLFDSSFSQIEPWGHVAMAGVGGYVGYNLQSWEDNLLVAVNEKRVQRGMTPITRQSLEITSRLTLPKDE